LRGPGGLPGGYGALLTHVGLPTLRPIPIRNNRGLLFSARQICTPQEGKGNRMQVLEAHGKPPRRGRTFLFIGGGVLLVVAAAVAYGIGKSTSPGSPGAKSGNTTKHHHTVATPLVVRATSPASGTTTAPTNADISITFSSAVALGAVTPTLSPAVAGTWVQASPTTIRYDLAAPLVPSSNEVVTIPGGS